MIDAYDDCIEKTVDVRVAGRYVRYDGVVLGVPDAVQGSACGVCGKLGSGNASGDAVVSLALARGKRYGFPDVLRRGVDWFKGLGLWTRTL